MYFRTNISSELVNGVKI